MFLRPVFLPLHVHRGNIESDSFQPQHHEETLGERTVADALAIASRLGHTNRENVHNVICVTLQSLNNDMKRKKTCTRGFHPLTKLQSQRLIDIEKKYHYKPTVNLNLIGNLM